MKNLEIGISETEKGFVVIPADEYSDMAMSIGALLAENEHLKERALGLEMDVKIMNDEIKELKRRESKRSKSGKH